MPGSVQTALARLLETRTLATLQEQLTADIIQQEVDRLNGIGTGYELPQKEGPFRTLARDSRRKSGYQGPQRQEQVESQNQTQRGRDLTQDVRRQVHCCHRISSGRPGVPGTTSSASHHKEAVDTSQTPAPTMPEFASSH